jgi:serine/threonine protein phosphatase 1
MDGLTLPVGKSRRLLAVGDIHGCREALRELLDRVAPTEHDQLVFLGDYIDRGPDSAGVVGDLLALRERLPGTVFLRGNHEQLLLEVLAGANPLNFLLNGGGPTIASYRKGGGWPPPFEHQAFFASLLPLFTNEEFIFVHAGLRPGIPLAEQGPDDLLWIREDFLHAEVDWGRIVVFGHTPFAKPLLTADRIGLDTGCVYGGRLTCCDVNTRQTWQASCAKL